MRNRTGILLVCIMLLSGCGHQIVLPDAYKANTTNYQRETEVVSKTLKLSDCGFLNGKTALLEVKSNIPDDQKIFASVDPAKFKGPNPELTVKQYQLEGGIRKIVLDRLTWYLAKKCGATLVSSNATYQISINITDAFVEIEKADVKKEGDPSAIGFTIDQKLKGSWDTISHLSIVASRTGSPARTLAVATPSLPSTDTKAFLNYKNTAKTSYHRTTEFHKGGLQMVLSINDENETHVGGELIASTIGSARVVSTFVLVWIPKMEGSLGLITIKDGNSSKAVLDDYSRMTAVDSALVKNFGNFGKASEDVERKEDKDFADTLEIYTGAVGFVGIGNVVYMVHQFINEMLSALSDR